MLEKFLLLEHMKLRVKSYLILWVLLLGQLVTLIKWLRVRSCQITNRFGDGKIGTLIDLV